MRANRSKPSFSIMLFAFLETRLKKFGIKQRNSSSRRNSFGFTEPRVEVTEIDPPNDDGRDNSQEQMPLLFRLVQEWALEEVAFRCESHPEEASPEHRDDAGRTLLHWVCSGSPPLHVVKAILCASPELATIQDNKGCLPLHVACSYRASTDVVEALLDSYPEGVNVPNNAGSYAIHILCDFGCPIGSMKAVLRTPDGASVVTKRDRIFRRTPLQILNERKNFKEFHQSLLDLRSFRKRQRVPTTYHPSDCNASCSGNLDEIPSAYSRLERMDFWQKATLLILTEYLGRPVTQNDSHLPLITHACISIQICPPSLLEFTVLLRTHELLVTDMSGNIPLHIATAISDESTICDVLSNQPIAASVRDRQSRIPLEIFLLRNPNVKYCDALEQLIFANPLGLETLNLDSRLYPLIWSRMAERKRTDVLFEVFRGNPSFFAMM